MPPLTLPTQLLSIGTALLSSGGIAVLTLFDIPELQSQPSSHSLPQIRWLFSRGSHIFPAAAVISGAGFSYLAYAALPARSLLRSMSVGEILRYGRVPGYLLAAVLAIGIGPWTTVMMVPTNFRLIELNEKFGGARSERSAKEGAGSGEVKSAEESVSGKGSVNQFADLSRPMGKTRREPSEEEDKEVRELLGKFGALNVVRALLIGAGGLVGLWTALV